MKAYVGTKIIQAERMGRFDFERDERGNPEAVGRKDEVGYKVVYPDGYVSWSPEKTFEAAYRLVSDEERALL